jgi:hypothetical protein
MPSLSRNALDLLLLACVNVTIPAVVTWNHHSGQASPTVALLSALLSLVVVNTVAVGTILSRRKRIGQDTSGGFLMGAAGLLVISGLLTAAGVYSISERNNYVELALSSIPLNEIHPEQKALVVEFLRRRAADSRDYEQLATQIKPISPALYSPDSFASEDIIRRVLEEYKKVVAADFAYHEQLERTMSDFRNKMMKIDPDYLKSFEAARQEQETREQKAFQLQQECETATQGLYEYAGAHTKEITVSDGEVHFANDGVRKEFSRQLKNSKSLYAQGQESFQELLKRQQQLRKAAGLASKSCLTTEQFI